MHCMSRSAITVKTAATSPADLLGLSATRPGTCFHDASTLSTRIWLQYWLQPQGCGRRCPGSLRPSSVTRLTVKCFGGLRAAHCVGDMLPALKKWLGGGGVNLSVNGYEADVGSAGGGWRRVAAGGGMAPVALRFGRALPMDGARRSAGGESAKSFDHISLFPLHAEMSKAGGLPTTRTRASTDTRLRQLG